MKGLESREAVQDRSIFIEGGPTGFLLIHGLGGTPVELRFVADGLARAGHTVHCCQLAGHCGTPAELKSSTWQQWYASVEAAHDRLSRRCDVVIAGGLSMGGILALRLALERRDQVDGVVLFAPTLHLDGWAMPWYGFMLRSLRFLPVTLDLDLAEREPYGLKDERIRAFVVNGMQNGDAGAAGAFSTPIRSFAQFNRLVVDVRAQLGAVKTPTLIVHPRDDDMASIANAHELQRKLGGLVELVVLDDSYHIVTLDRQRHVVVERSLAFAGRIEGARQRTMAVRSSRSFANR
jgi:carboxylesterase